MVSIPSSCARVSASPAEVPQSTQTSRFAPSAASRSTVSTRTPYPSVNRLGRNGTTLAPEPLSARVRTAVEHTPSQS